MIQIYQSGGEFTPLDVSIDEVDSSELYKKLQAKQGEDSNPFTKATTATQSTEDLKEILSLLKSSDLLPAEMQLISTNLGKLFSSKSLYKNGKLNTSTLVQLYLKTLQQVNTSKFNKQAYDEAYKSAIKNGGLGEAAITESGQIVVMGENGLQTLSPEQALASQVKILTNSDLLELRASSPNMAFNNSLLTIVENSVGQEKVTDLLQKTIKSLGSTTLKSGMPTALAALADAQDQAAAEGSNDLSAKDLYNNSVIDKNQYIQIQNALSYLWQTLPQNAKSWLQLHSDGSQEGAIELMSTLANANQSVLKSNITSGRSGRGKSSSNSETDDAGFTESTWFTPSYKVKTGSAAAWMLGHNTDINSHLVTFNSGTTHSLMLPAYTGPMTDTSGKSYGATTLDELSKSQFAGALDFSQATFAGQFITAPDRVVVDGNKLYSIYLPIDETAAMSNVIKPNLNFLRDISAIEQKIREEHITDIDEINKLYTDAQLPVKYTKNGLVNTSVYKRFGVLEGTATGQSVEDKDTLDVAWIQSVASENKYDRVNRIIKKNDDKYSFTGESLLRFWNQDGDGMYDGLIFIPVNGNFITTSVTSGSTHEIPHSDMLDYMDAERQKDLQNKKRQGADGRTAFIDYN